MAKAYKQETVGDLTVEPLLEVCQAQKKQLTLQCQGCLSNTHNHAKEKKKQVYVWLVSS